MSTANECVPKYEPGARITGHCEAAVVGKRFVDISDPKQGTPSVGLDTTASGGNVVISPATAGGLKCGVASHDQAINGQVTFIADGVVPVTADTGGITAGQEVEVGTAGKAKTKASGKSVGRAWSSATAGNDALIQLYTSNPA